MASKKTEAPSPGGGAMQGAKDFMSYLTKWKKKKKSETPAQERAGNTKGSEKEAWNALAESGE